MTRKCIFCKETNYKTTHSFFSAPKDAETRKKWKDAIGIPNYTVCDETYVCSKHFDASDIISEWKSGTPPHVVTIKYKKCRLRQGAVPITNRNKRYHDRLRQEEEEEEEEYAENGGENDDDDDDDDEDDYEEEEDNFQVNKGFKTLPTIRKKKKKSLKLSNTNTKDTKDAKDTKDKNTKNMNTNKALQSILDLDDETPQFIDSSQIINYHDVKNGTIIQGRVIVDDNSEEMIISDPIDNNTALNIVDQEENFDDDDDNTDAFYIGSGDTQQLYYVKTIANANCKTDFTEHDIINDENSKDKIIQADESINNDDNKAIENYDYSQACDDEDEPMEQTEHHDDDDDDEDDDGVDDEDIICGDDDIEAWKKMKAEKLKSSSTTTPAKSTATTTTTTTAAAATTTTKKNKNNDELMETDPLEVNEEYGEDEDDEDDGMLFEDLLDNYTEVLLPNGWCSITESRGNNTTIIFAFIKTTLNGIPWIQKQVFIQNDMLMRCSAAGKELNPKIHNLIKQKKPVKVYSIDDVNDVIKEFDNRTICQGTFEKIDPAHMDSRIGYRDGINWRHVNCPIIINNGKIRCTKCSSLNKIAKRKKSKLPQAAESAELLNKDRKIFMLQKLLKEKTRNNDAKKNINNDKLILKYLDNINIPNVQKIMIKECLKVPLFKDTTVEHSESWIFLSLRIYMESQRIYKYLLENKYIKLPSVKIMKRYLNQIKTDVQFYKLFKKSIEKFGFSEEQLGEPS